VETELFERGLDVPETDLPQVIENPQAERRLRRELEDPFDPLQQVGSRLGLLAVGAQGLEQDFPALDEVRRRSWQSLRYSHPPSPDRRAK
jgi:hypothetical protein